MSTSGTARASPAPSAVGTVRPATIADNGKVQVACPDLFYGDRDKVDDWLMQLQVYFTFQKGLESNKKPVFATTYMRGNAQKWIKPYLTKYLGDNDNDGDLDSIKEWMEDFAKFKKEVKKILGPSNEDRVAVRVIQHLKQQRSASEYATHFKRHAVLTGWDDDALMVMFRRGLKENVKDELAFDGCLVETLDELISRAINIDDTLYERAMERKHDARQQGSYGFGERRGIGYNNRPKHNPYQGTVPMELDNIQHGRKGEKKKPFTKNTIKCYACGKLGHMARNCRSKNKVHRQQLNALDGDWKVIELQDGSPEISDSQEEESECNWESMESSRELNQLQGTTGGTTQKDKPEQERESIKSPTDLTKEEAVQDEAKDTQTTTVSNQNEETTREELPPWARKPRIVVNYGVDPRNLRHGDLNWFFCVEGLCQYHWHARREAGTRPPKRNCRKPWDRCENNYCAYHLWDKRENRKFPGRPTTWYHALYQRQWTPTRDCRHDAWIYCITVECPTHEQDKFKNGFLRCDGKGWRHCPVTQQSYNSGKD